VSEESTEGAAPDQQDPDVLLYDFFKFLTTLAILILGGVLSLVTANTEFSSRSLVVVIVFLSISAVTALTGADSVVRNRLRRRPITRWTWIYQGLSMGALGAGTGMFLSMWLEGLK